MPNLDETFQIRQVILSDVFIQNTVECQWLDQKWIENIENIYSNFLWKIWFCNKNNEFHEALYSIVIQSYSTIFINTHPRHRSSELKQALFKNYFSFRAESEEMPQFRFYGHSCIFTKLRLVQIERPIRLFSRPL